MSAILAIVNDSIARWVKLLSFVVIEFANYSSKIDSFLVSGLSRGNGVCRFSRSRESIEQALRVGIGENAPITSEIIRPLNVLILAVLASGYSCCRRAYILARPPAASRRTA